MAIGGLEYTEGLTTTMSHRPGRVPVEQNGKAENPILPFDLAYVGGTAIDFYHVPSANLDNWLGPIDDVDRELLRYSHVAFTNDVRSAEWKIETHVLDGKTAPEVMTNITQDLKLMFAMRAELARDVQVQMARFPGESIVITPGQTGNLSHIGGAGLFEYRPSVQAEGKAQITVQYQNKETIRRICLLNASKYLTGAKIGEGEDVAHAIGSPGLVQSFLGLVGSTSFSTAETLLKALTATAVAVPDGNGATVLTQDDVGLIKLMIINDAIAATMPRYNATKGEAQEKNIQRFFPKSQRQSYVNALAGHDVGVPNLATLRAQLSAGGVAAAMAQQEWNNADPFALRVDETVLNASQADAARISDARRRNKENQTVSATDQAFIKDQVLGANGALLAVWIQRATLAYTDPSGNARLDHVHNGAGNVVSADRFTPVAARTDGTIIHGAVYEFREREVKMRDNDYDEAIKVMAALLEAS
jgi:hypothetical protein